ncbi:MAG: ABC transporter permease subunit [Gammaproteobacteria bacterium]|nr:ABC transporter permease subunit [Gammaproteobacteria bacterium]
MATQVITQKKYRSQSASARSSLIATYVALVILSLIWIIPILWIVLNAFRADVGNVSSSFFPIIEGGKLNIGIANFKKLFTATYYGVNHAFLRWLLNTIIVSIIDCIVSTFLVLSVAYCMSKLRFKLRKPFMNITMILGLFPGFMSMIAIYFLLKSIGLSGNVGNKSWLNLVGLILSYSAGAGMGYQVAKGFFDVIPSSLVESAKLDGCTNFKIFKDIILPLSKPIIIYQALMAFTGPWMDFIFAKVIIGTGAPEMWTVSVGLYSMMFGAQADVSLFTQFAAGCVIVGIPIVTLFISMQSYYVEGVTAGAVKG